MGRTAVDVSRETLASTLLEASKEMGVTLSAHQYDALLDYVLLLVKWNAVYNLTAVRDPVDMVRLHLLDSMAVDVPVSGALRHLSSVRLMDLGSGAGLPGIVLAILHPDWEITLVDAVQKKVAFTTQAIGQLKLQHVRAVHGRIEQLAFSTPFDAVISRAFSDLDLFVNLALPHLNDEGVLLAMQGKPDARCVPPFTRQTLHPLRVPGLSAARHLLILDRLKD